MNTNETNSWKVANECGLPHEVVVAKLRKYKRFKSKPLALFREGTMGKTPEDREIIYSFDQKAYDACVVKERKASLVRKGIQSENAKANLLDSNGIPKYISKNKKK